MSNAPRDDNRVPAGLGTSTADDAPTPLVIDAVSGRLQMDVGYGPDGVLADVTVTRDDNRVPIAYGTSSVDGTTPVPLRINPTSGALLIDLSLT